MENWSKPTGLENGIKIQKKLDALAFGREKLKKLLRELKHRISLTKEELKNRPKMVDVSIKISVAEQGLGPLKKAINRQEIFIYYRVYQIYENENIYVIINIPMVPAGSLAIYKRAFQDFGAITKSTFEKDSIVSMNSLCKSLQLGIYHF